MNYCIQGDDGGCIRTGGGGRPKQNAPHTSPMSPPRPSSSQAGEAAV